MAHSGGRRRAGITLVMAGMFALAGAVTTPVAADQPVDPGNSADAPGQSGDKPGGNNGVLKVDGIPVDEVGGGPEGAPGRSHRDNEPHVSCQFNLDWYGFEEGAGTSDVTFELWGPNKGYELTPSPAADVGGDEQGNADDQDATQQYDLSGALAAAKADGAEANDQQGWLVKVTVETPGLSQGAAAKHKVFWVEDDCGEPNRPPQGCVTNCSPLVLGQVVTTTTTTTTTTTVAPTTAPPETTAAPTTVGVQVLGVQLARTGTGTSVLLAASGLLLLVGGAALLAGTRGAPARR